MRNDIELGVVDNLGDLGPLKPAEFVVLGIQQLAGQIEPYEGRGWRNSR
jgi:hypothetical protein